MQLPPLTNGIIERRYKRFLADVVLNSGERVVAHCANTGAMTGCWEPGARVQVSASNNPKRKLGWSLERVDMGQGWIGVNTARTNRIIEHFLVEQRLPEFVDYPTIQTEPVFTSADNPRSRFDFLLTNKADARCYIEVKNATLLCDEAITFPDAVTERGKKHLQLLIEAVNAGHRAVMLYAVNRPEGDYFRVAEEIDPAYAAVLREAKTRGVEQLRYALNTPQPALL